MHIGRRWWSWRGGGWNGIQHGADADVVLIVQGTAEQDPLGRGVDYLLTPPEWFSSAATLPASARRGRQDPHRTDEFAAVYSRVVAGIIL
jgi:hypothetical protein